MIPPFILSYGRTSILALFVAMTIFFVINKNYRYLLLLSMIAIIVIIIDGYSYLQLFFEKGGSLYSLSGRLYNWP